MAGAAILGTELEDCGCHGEDCSAGNLMALIEADVAEETKIEKTLQCSRPRRKTPLFLQGIQASQVNSAKIAADLDALITQKRKALHLPGLSLP